MLNIGDDFISGNKSCLSRRAAYRARIDDLTAVAVPREIFGEVPIEVLNDGAQALFVALNRLRVGEKWMVIRAIDRSLDEDLESLADVEEIELLIAKFGPGLSQGLQSLQAGDSLCLDLLDQAGQLIGDLPEQDLAKPAPQLVAPQKRLRQLFPCTLREELGLFGITMNQGPLSELRNHIFQHMPPEP